MLSYFSDESRLTKICLLILFITSCFSMLGSCMRVGDFNAALAFFGMITLFIEQIQALKLFIVLNLFSLIPDLIWFSINGTVIVGLNEGDRSYTSNEIQTMRFSLVCSSFVFIFKFISSIFVFYLTTIISSKVPSAESYYSEPSAPLRFEDNKSSYSNYSQQRYFPPIPASPLT
eukprot:c18437_g2_i1.p1 GENE.c18437_g2_i1~~c18437_g2_i1.p1  ORF type:complete len:174 (-),score=24.35 c18437_g2_i1:79-600(-)